MASADFSLIVAIRASRRDSSRSLDCHSSWAAAERRSSGEQAGQFAQPQESESWSPERHRVISGEEVVELLPAIAAREPTSGYLFYDCQTDDVRLVLTDADLNLANGVDEHGTNHACPNCHEREQEDTAKQNLS